MPTICYAPQSTIFDQKCLLIRLYLKLALIEIFAYFQEIEEPTVSKGFELRFVVFECLVKD